MEEKESKKILAIFTPEQQKELIKEIQYIEKIPARIIKAYKNAEKYGHEYFCTKCKGMHNKYAQIFENHAIYKATEKEIIDFYTEKNMIVRIYSKILENLEKAIIKLKKGNFSQDTKNTCRLMMKSWLERLKKEFPELFPEIII